MASEVYSGMEPQDHPDLPCIRSGARILRCGCTTGSCAALAAAGAARLLLSGEVPERLRLVTPKGWTPY